MKYEIFKKCYVVMIEKLLVKWVNALFLCSPRKYLECLIPHTLCLSKKAINQIKKNKL